jgi:hypothetical protein
MSEQLAGLIRHALTFAAGILVARGKLDAGSVETIVGGAMTLIGLAWSWVAKKKAEA